jgi:tRNA G46 methylase TrmB
MRNKFLPSFVQRKGRITKSQEDNLNSLHKYHVTSHAQILLEKSNFKRVILEIGFGNGENLINLAKENPTKFIHRFRSVYGWNWAGSWSN